MALRLLIDDCSIRRDLLQAIQHYSTNSNVAADLLCVGDANGPTLGTLDPDLIDWSLRLDRAIVSNDKNTLIGNYYLAVEAGRNPPPLIIRRSRAGVGQLAEALILVALVYGASEYGRVVWLP